MTRYDLTEDVATGVVDITPVPESHDGRYVLHSDYQALLNEAVALRDAVKTHSQCTHFCEVCGKDDPCENDDVCYVLDDTPITKSAMGEE